MIRVLLHALLFVLLLASPARAQESLRIAAVVNDQVISVYDLEMQLRLTILFSGLPDTVENRKRLVPQVLRTMIDDELKRQEAKRQKIPMTEKEVETIVRRMEKSNGLKEGGLDELLKARQIDKAALNKQIEAQIYWGKLVGGYFGPQIQISDEEVNAAVARIERNKGKPEYHVFEIFLPVDKPENDATVQSFAHKLIEQLNQGASFRALARNFSKSATADEGGDLGWNAQGQLGPELDSVVVRLQPGQVSAPIRAADGYYILRLEDRRTAGGIEEPATSPIVNVQQFAIQLDKNAKPNDIAAAMDSAKRIAAKAKNCQELEKAGKEVGSPLSGNLGDIRLDALGPQQRSLIRALPVLTPSQPMQTPDGIIVLMVCKRDDQKAASADTTSLHERVEHRLVEERLGMAASQFLKDLRRNAFVDVRI